MQLGNNNSSVTMDSNPLSPIDGPMRSDGKKMNVSSIAQAMQAVVGSTPHGGGQGDKSRIGLMNTSTPYSGIGGENSEDLLTTLDGGDQSSYFTTKRFHSMQLEQKDDVIEQLKAQVELLESERDNKWKRQVEELEEDKVELAAKNKKWIAKYEEEIEKNKAKFNDLHK